MVQLIADRDDVTRIQKRLERTLIAASCDHALVTNRLARALAEADYEVVNDRHRELMVCTPDGKRRFLWSGPTAFRNGRG